MAAQSVRQNLWQFMGRVAFWLSWPLLWWYLRSGWRTRLVVVADDKLLIVKSWLGNQQWGLPGGGLHTNEDPLVGALRELNEETHLHLKAEQLHFIYKDKARHYGLHFNYHCFGANLAKTQPIVGQKYEITDLAWVPLGEVAGLKVTGETKRALAAWTKRQSLLK